MINFTGVFANAGFAVIIPFQRRLTVPAVAVFTAFFVFPNPVAEFGTGFQCTAVGRFVGPFVITARTAPTVVHIFCFVFFF